MAVGIATIAIMEGSHAHPAHWIGKMIRRNVSTFGVNLCVGVLVGIVLSICSLPLLGYCTWGGMVAACRDVVWGRSERASPLTDEEVKSMKSIHDNLSKKGTASTPHEIPPQVSPEKDKTAQEV